MWNPFKKNEEEESELGQMEYINQEESNTGENISMVDEEKTDEANEEHVEFSLPAEEEPAEEFFVEKPSPALRKAIRGLLLAMVSLVPLWLLPFTAPNDVLISAKQILIYVLVVASLVIWLVMIVRQGGLSFKRTGWEWGVLAVLGSSLLASVLSSQVYNSLISGNGFMTLALAALTFFLLVNFFDREDYEKIANFFLLGSTLAGLIGILSIWGVSISEWLGISATQVFNPVGVFSSLGALSALALVFLVALQFNPLKVAEVGEEKKRTKGWWKAIHISGFVLFPLVLLVVNWWVLYLVLAVGMAGIILGLWSSAYLSGRKIKLAPLHIVVPMGFLVSAIVLILGVVYFSLDFSGIARRSLPVGIVLSQSGTWEVAREVVNTKPVFGVGDENFIQAYDQFKPESINSTPFWNAHFSNASSEFFNLIVERGLVGLAAITFLFFYVFRSAFQKKGFCGEEGDNREDGVRSAIYFWITFPVFGAALALFFLYPFNVVLTFSFWVLLAMMGLTVSGRVKKLNIKMDVASLPSLFASLILVLILAAGAVGGYVLFHKYSGSLYFAKAAQVTGATPADYDRAILLLNKAVAADSNEDVYLNSLATLLLKKIDQEVNNKVDKPEEVRVRLESLTRATVQAANRMTADHKNNAINWFNSGFVYENLIPILTGSDQAAIAAYGEYVKRAPRDPNGYVRMGDIFLVKADQMAAAITEAKSKKQTIKNEKELVDGLAADYKKAEENFKKAIDLKADLAMAFYNLGIVYERQGRLKDAIKQLETLQTGNANNTGLAFELGLLYYRNGQKEKALTEMNRAVVLFKNYANARWYLALMLEEKGEVDAAIMQLEAILSMEINRDNPVVRAKIDSLEAGKREFPPAKVTSKKPLE